MSKDYMILKDCLNCKKRLEQCEFAAISCCCDDWTPITFRLEERHQDLFTMPEQYYFVHCISADLKMGAGIAVDMKKNYPYIVQQLKNNKPNVGTCDITALIINLITKSKYYGKPTYDTIRMSLEDMKEKCIRLDIKHLAMPLIGCGLDRLSWGNVREIIIEIFKDVGIDIVVCRK